MLAIPVARGSKVVGVISIKSTEYEFFRPEDLGRVQLLGALLAVVYDRTYKVPMSTEATARLGRALSGVRQDLRLTQDELAARASLSRIALSQWERGRWPPSLGPIYRWCYGLGLVAEDTSPQVSFLDVTPYLLSVLRENPEELCNLSPERFEHVIAERIDRMGYDVRLTGATAGTRPSASACS
jgi:transcriptional regulator with XRE-family HTH domain